MTNFIFEDYLDWISKNAHYFKCGIGPNNDTNINHVSLQGELINHPRIFRSVGVFSRILNEAIEKGGVESPFKDGSIGDPRVWILNTERFTVNEEILIEDNDGSEIRTITSITANESLQLNSNLGANYDRDELFTVSSIREIILDNPDTGAFANGDYVQLDTADDYLIRKILEAPEENGNITIKCGRISRSFSQDDIVSVIFPVNGIAPDIDDAIVIPEKTFPFNPQQFGAKAGSLSAVSIKDAENDPIDKNSMAVESLAAIEYGSINLLFTPNDEDFSKYAQDLNFDNPMIMPGYSEVVNDVNIYPERFDYSSDADMQKIWKGTTTTIDTDTLKWTYSSNSVYALFPLPLNFVARSGGANTLTFRIKGTGGNTGTLNIILHSADGETLTTPYTGDLTSTSFANVSIDFDSFTGKQFIKKIEFRITSGTGILYLDDITPFKVPSFDDLMGNPTGILGTEGDAKGSMAVYYDVREAPIHTLTANASAAELTTIQLTIADSSDFTVGDKIVIYDLLKFEFAEVDTVDDGTHITVTPSHGVFYFDYTTANFGSVQLLTYKVRNIAAAYSANSQLRTWIKVDVAGDFLLIKPDAGEWDRDSVSEPSALFKNNELYLSYTGRNGAAYGIGFAFTPGTSLVAFTKLPDNPFLATHDNSKIVELNEFEGLTCRDTSNNIKLYKQNTGFLTHIDFHITILVKYDSSLGYPENEMVLYDQGNARIVLNKDLTVTFHAYFDGSWISTPLEDINNIGDHIRNGFGIEITKDHWNEIVVQSAGDRIGIYKVGVMINQLGIEYFTDGGWKYDSDVAGNATSIDITLDNPNLGVPVADQSIYLWSQGKETTKEYDKRFHWQLNRITSVTTPATDVYRLNLLFPIGPWGFKKTTDAYGDMGPTLAEGIAAGSKGGQFISPVSSDGEFYWAQVGERKQETDVGGDGEIVLDPSKFVTPKIGSAVDGTKSFTKGLIGHCDVSTSIVDSWIPHANVNTRLGMFSHAMQSDSDWHTLPKPEWWFLDLKDIAKTTNSGAPPPMQNGTAYWAFEDWDAINLKIPDSAQSWTLYSNGATPVSSAGFGFAFSFGVGDNFLTYKYSNMNLILTLLEPTTGPSEVEIPVNVLPQLFATGTALISTILGNIPYYEPMTVYDSDDIAHIILDLDETATLPSTLDLDGNIYLPANTSLNINLSVKKATSWNLIKVYTSDGFTVINETIDLSTYVADDLLYYLRLKFELITDDGVSSPVIIDFTASATGFVGFPSTAFINTWIETTTIPCLRVNMIDDTNTYYDKTSTLKKIPNMNYEIPTHIDDESDILPSEITLTFENYDGFWNWNNLASPLNGKNYLDFRIQILAGFDSEYISQGIYKIERIEQSLDGTVEVTCSSELREILDQVIGYEAPQLFPGVKSAKEIIREWLIDYGNISTENIYFEDSIIDFFVSNVEIDNESIISVVRELAQAANYVIYINNQGEIRVINRAEMNTSGAEYSNTFPTGMTAGNLITGARLASATRKNLIKKAKVVGANNVSAISENTNIIYGRHYSTQIRFIQDEDKAQDIADQLILDYGLTKQILSGGLKYSPHLRLLDILSFENPVSGDDSYLIVSINRDLTNHKEKITALLI